MLKWTPCCGSLTPLGLYLQHLLPFTIKAPGNQRAVPLCVGLVFRVDPDLVTGQRVVPKQCGTKEGVSMVTPKTEAAGHSLGLSQETFSSLKAIGRILLEET